MLTKKVKRSLKDLTFYILLLVILVLTSINIANFLAPKKVLGASIQETNTDKFWQDFLAKNPDYVPGWIEIGNTEKAKQIDPNYDF